jgi:predicted phosphodiesterase
VILVLSDLHMGLPGAPTPSSIEPLLAGAEELILNGDAAEEASPRFAARAAAMLAELGDRCGRRGVRLVRIEGNHDPGSGELHAWRAEGAVLVTHGHAFHPAIAPWVPHARRLAEAFRAHHDSRPDMPEPERSLAAARAASLAERGIEEARAPLAELAAMAMRPWAFPQVIGWWRIFPELSARFLERAAAARRGAGHPEPLAVVSGHSHKGGAWQVRGRLVVNTGSFTFPGRPHAATIGGGEVRLVPLVRRAGEWRQDAAAARTWRIDEVARATAARSTPAS